MNQPATQTYNVLEILELNVEMDNQDTCFNKPRAYITYTASFKARIKYTDQSIQKNIVVANILTESSGVNGNALIRTCIEKFLNKEYSSIRMEYYDNPSTCKIDKNRVDAIECNWENQELKELFSHIFNSSNWSLENKTITC